MLENLFNLIKEQGADSVINNSIIPNKQNNAVIAGATHAVTSGLQNEFSGGGLQNILSMFGNGGTGNSLLNNPIVGNIISKFTNNLTGNHGIASNDASGIANNLIPGVISSLISKTNNANDNSFDMNGIISSLTNGTQAGGFDLQGIVSKFAGGSLDTDGDGKVEISHIISKVSSSRQSGGGIMDTIKSIMN